MITQMFMRVHRKKLADNPQIHDRYISTIVGNSVVNIRACAQIMSTRAKMTRLKIGHP